MKKPTVKLPLAFYRTPATARTTMTLNDLQTLLLTIDGRFTAADRTVWELESRKMVPDVYEVTARRVIE